MLTVHSDGPVSQLAALTGPGALRKLGTGTPTLTEENPYTGNTTVAAGTLVEVGTLGFRVERAAANGGWERLTPQLIPATGWDQRPQTYAFTEVSPTAIPGAKNLLLEVDRHGQETVLAEALVCPATTASVQPGLTGLSLQVRGAPNGVVVIESATAISGPWNKRARTPLDQAGAASVVLETTGPAPMRCYRVFAE